MARAYNPQPVRAAALWRFLRPATLPAPLAGVLGGAVSASAGWPADGARLTAALLSALLLTGASNGINQIADLETDRINRPDRPLPAGEISTREAWAIFWVLSALAFALAASVNRAYLACVAVTLPVTSAYSVMPFRTKRIPFLANATIATPRGLLLVLAGWAVGGGAMRTEAWVLGTLMWIYIFGAATTKDFADTQGDEATGCVTLPILWGPRAAARFVAPFLVLPFALYPLAAGFGLLPGGAARWGALGALLSALGIAAGRHLIRDPQPPAGGSPHRAWGLMYLQLTLAHIGSAVVMATLP